MTVGRNDPCPCGSGKKFKKCCVDVAAKNHSLVGKQPTPAAPEGSVTSNQHVVNLLNEAETLRKQGHYPEAVELYNLAIEMEPTFAVSYFNRGIVYFSMKNYDVMHADFVQAEKLAPNFPEMQHKMGIPYVHAKDFPNAIRALERSIALDPNNPDTWLWLARSHHGMVNDKVAYEVLTGSIRRFPKNAVLLVAQKLYISYIQDSWGNIHAERERFMRGMEELFRMKLSLATPDKDVHFIPSLLAYHGINDKTLRQRFAALMLEMCPSLNFVAPHCNPGATRIPGPIRVGFVSENTDINTTNQFIADVLGALNDDSELEIFLFSKLPAGLADTRYIAGKVKHFIGVSSDLVPTRQTISDCQLDIVVYLEPVNYHLSYFLGFARLAKAQCMWGGFPVTTGLPNMDYFFTAHKLEPEKPEEHFTEKLEMFDRIIAYFRKPVIASPTKSKAEYGLPEGDVRIYLCPVMLHKIHPDMYQTFADILARDEKAHIVMFDPNEGFMRQRIENNVRRHITPEQHERVRFIPFADLQNFLHIMKLADAVLDVPHFSFGTTAFLALGVDVPFVTFRNPLTCGRTAVFMYEKIGMPEMIADTQRDYVALALRIAQDPAYRAEMSKRIHERCDVFFEDQQTSVDLAERFKELFVHHSAKVAA